MKAAFIDSDYPALRIELQVQNMSNICYLDNTDNTFHIIYVMCKRTVLIQQTTKLVIWSGSEAK